jgi:4-hydroxythreonine-4-phosphate dehydrogenase
VTLPLLAISTGEPAGVGPDICLALASEPSAQRLAFLGDATLLRERAITLGISVTVEPRQRFADVTPHATGRMQLIAHDTAVPVVAGRLDRRNAAYVVQMLRTAGNACLEGQCDALVTAPVQKSVIAESGVPFSGHTEFLAELCGGALPVMLLARAEFRVALVTTHLPLRAVPDAITPARLRSIIEVLHRDLARLYGIERPRIMVLGLNPHAGENATLGTEERDVIGPTLEQLRADGFAVIGPQPGDTAFTRESLARCDVVLAMYHDQGLAPIKAEGFGGIVNITLGLPIIRTSVDHGTALALAGTGQARHESLRAAVELAAEFALRSPRR